MERHVVKTTVFDSGRSITKYIGVMKETDLPDNHSTARADIYYDVFDSRDEAIDFARECTEEEKNNPIAVR